MVHSLHRTLSLAILCVSVAIAAPVVAQTFPSKVVRVVAPYPAGGPVDLLARALTRELSAVWGQQVLVENVSGGDTSIGASRVNHDERPLSASERV